MLPKEIGPHEGIEFELIEKGVKHLALFGFDYPNNDHYEHASRLKLNVLKFGHNFPSLSSDLKNVVFYRDGYKDQADELVKSVKLASTRPSNWEELEYKIGSLLGYSHHETTVFIQHFKRAKD